MAAVLNEGTQYLDVGGTPIAAGLVYIGDVNTDPVANPKNIFSDRELQVALANPQTLDDFGRSTNKIWTDGKFSIQVNNSAAVQQFQDLDAGESTTGATSISLDSIVGSNTITASGGITAYTSNQQFVFKTALANTGNVTLNVDSIGAKSVVKNVTQEINPGEFEIDQTVIVVYNATNDNFEWTNQNNKVVDFYTGTVVASAATTDIWTSTDGNAVHVTGAVNITSLGTAPNIGASKKMVFDGTPLLTNGANLILRGGLDFTAGVNDILEVYANTTTQFIVDTPTRLPAGHLFNLNTANGTADQDAIDHDIIVQPGDAAATNNAGDLSISTALTKKIDANFAAGNDAGGLADTLTVANTTWYHVFIVDLTAGGSDIGFDINLDASLLLASTGVGTKFRRIGSVLTDGSANILGFSQGGSTFLWDVGRTDIDTVAITTTAALITISTPLGVKTDAIFAAGVNTNGFAILYTSPDQDDLLPEADIFSYDEDAGSNIRAPHFPLRTNTSSQLRARADGSTTHTVYTSGWNDTRGRDA